MRQGKTDGRKSRRRRRRRRKKGRGRKDTLIKRKEGRKVGK